MMDYGSIENEDPENEDPLRKRRPPTKTKTPYENEGPLQKTKTPYENEDPLRKWRSPTKTKTLLFFVGNEIILLETAVNLEIGQAYLIMELFWCIFLSRSVTHQIWKAL